MEQKRPYALITGASKGIGRCFAEECASRKRNLALVSLLGEDLENVSKEIAAKYGVDVRWFEGDLSKTEGPQAVFDWTVAESLPIDLLINNAGFGTAGTFVDGRYGQNLAMLNLNMLAPYMLCKLFISELSKHKGAGILNVSSGAAFFPMPYKAVYSATKAFIYYFSLAIEFELRGTNVHVGCVMPGGVPTNAATLHRIKSAGFLGRITSVMPEDIASISMRGMDRRKRRIVPGFMNKVSRFMPKLMPLNVSMRFAANAVKKGAD